MVGIKGFKMKQTKKGTRNMKDEFKAEVQRTGNSLMVIIPKHLYHGLNKKFNLKWRDIVKVEITPTNEVFKKEQGK